MIERDLGVAWRTCFTGLSFLFFGLGSLVLGLLVLPIVHLANRDREAAQSASRAAVRKAFRLFIWFMRSTGVLDYRITGKTDIPPGTLVIANHPSLIDVIFILAFLPDTLCVVKDALDSNPFTRLIVRGTGYLTNRDPVQMVKQCVNHINNSGIVLLFPEATRTVPGEPLDFKRAAGNVITLAHCPTTPIFLNITPPTLAKGESWLRVPASKVRYEMDIGEPLPAADLLDAGLKDRMNARSCTERLRSVFINKQKAVDRSEPDDNNGRPAEGHQSPDRQYS